MAPKTFDIDGMQSQDMKIKLESILPSLANNLYGDDWRIAIRELLQNCHDSFICTGVNINDGEIHIIPNRAEGTLTFKDNGMGMTQNEVEEYLATVGAGYKREQLEKMSSGAGDLKELKSIIGQYGIGFLSAFIIAEKVQVLSKSRNSNVPGVRAIFTGETKWYAIEDDQLEIGTQIILQLKQESLTDPESGKNISAHDLLNFERLKKEVRRFGDLLPYPIYIHRSPDDYNGDLSNATKWPWEDNPTVNQNDLYDFYKKRHIGANEPIYATRISLFPSDDEIQAEGLIYFPQPSENKGSLSEQSGAVELFCRRMFISNKMASLLPEWASFVGVIIECPHLSPTLNRNDVIRHNSTFMSLKNAIKRQITETLQFLAEKQPTTFFKILGAYRQAFNKALFTDYHESPSGEEDFFKAIINYIPFSVISRTKPTGEAMTLPKYRDELNKRIPTSHNETQDEKQLIYYLFDLVSGTQYRAMIVNRDIPVILTNSEAEYHLLKAYGEIHKEDITVTDVKDMLESVYVDKVDQRPYAKMMEYLSTLDGDGPDEVKAARFDPSHVPAILMISSSTDPVSSKLIEKMMNDGQNVFNPRLKKILQRELDSATDGKLYKTVILNDQNALIRTIRSHCAGDKSLSGSVADVLHEIFHNASIFSDPRVGESEHFFEHRNKLLLDNIEKEDALTNAKRKSDHLSIELKNLQNKTTIQSNGLEANNRVLMLTDLIGSTRMIGFIVSGI